MPAPFKLSFGPWMKGLDTRLLSQQLPDDRLERAENVELAYGEVSGRLGDGTAVTGALGSNQRTIAYVASTYWVSSPDPLWYLHDGYTTVMTRSGATPLKYTPSLTTDLGIKPIGLFSWSLVASGVLTGIYRYAFVARTDAGLTSNPQAFEITTSTSAQNVLFTNIPTHPDSRVTKRDIYRSQANGDVLYYLYTIEDNVSATTITDDSPDTNLDLTRILTWGPGGFIDSGGAVVEDHSPAPPLTVLSDQVHAVNDAVGLAGGGIYFAAVGATARWSMLGFPDYWPAANSFDLPEEVLAILSHAGVTYYFLPSGIYEVSGNSDSSLAWRRTHSLFGPLPGFGRSVKRTPYGMLFVAREGLARFDGSRSEVITAERLSPAFLAGTAIYDALYHDGRYRLSLSSMGTVAALGSLTSGGSGYTSSPTPWVRAPDVAGGRRAVLTATVAAGVVTGVAISERGFGYTSEPSVTFLGGGGSGAAMGAPVLDGGGTILFDLRDGVEGLRITTTTNIETALTIANPAAPMTAETLREGLGYVDEIIVSEPGLNYLAVPAVTIAAPASGTTATAQAFVRVQDVQVSASGSSYTAPPLITFTTAPAGGRTAQGYTQLSGDKVVAVVLTDPGSGYSTAPACTTPSGGATFTVRLHVEYIGVTNPGSGYTGTVPRVTMTAAPDGGVTATAAATLRPFGYHLAGLGYYPAGNQLVRIGGLRVTPGTGAEALVGTVDSYGISGTGMGRWRQIGTLGIARQGITPVTIAGNIYVTAGTSNTGASRYLGSLTSTERSTDGGATWANFSATGSPPAVMGYGAATDGTDLFLYGGFDSNGDGTRNLYKLNPAGSQSVTKSTDNTGTGTWPGSNFVSLTGATNGTYTLSVTITGMGPFNYQFTWNGVNSQVYSGWQSGLTVVINGGGAGILTFITTTSPPGTNGSDSVVVAAVSAAWTNFPSAPDSDYDRGGCAIVYSAGVLYIFGGSKKSTTAGENAVITFTVATQAWARDTSATAAGMTGRIFCAAGIAGDGKIVVYGGVSILSDYGIAIANVWEFSPSASTKWRLASGNVLGLGARGRMGFTMAATSSSESTSDNRLFLFGGSSDLKFAHGDLHFMDLDQVTDSDLPTAIYGTQLGGGAIRPLERGLPVAWTIRLPAQVSPNPGRRMTWQRMRVDGNGSLTIKVLIDDQAPRTIKTMTNLVRGSPQRFWLPAASGTKVMGHRIGLQVEGVADSGSAIGSTLSRIEIEGMLDGEAAANAS